MTRWKGENCGYRNRVCPVLTRSDTTPREPDTLGAFAFLAHVAPTPCEQSRNELFVTATNNTLAKKICQPSRASRRNVTAVTPLSFPIIIAVVTRAVVEHVASSTPAETEHEADDGHTSSNLPCIRIDSAVRKFETAVFA